MTDLRNLANSSRDLASLAEKIAPAANAAPQTSSPPQLQTIQTLAAQLRQNASVAAAQTGTITFFTGPDDAAKVVAAQSLAGSLHRELNRIDLSTLVSQHAGDTINVLTQLLHSSAATGAILLFDEADALFDKRTSVQDSQDRYAGASADELDRSSAFLQLLEQYPGLIILAVHSTDGWNPSLLQHAHATLKFPPTP